MSRNFLSILVLILIFTVSFFPQNWISQTSNVSNSIRCVVPVDQNNVWCSTIGGKILRTNNGGTTWVTKTDPRAGYNNYTMAAISNTVAWVSMVDPTNNRDWRVAKTTDGGTTWSEQLIDANSFGFLINFWNSPSEGLIGGDPSPSAPNNWIIKRTTDAGINWTAIPAGNIPQADGANKESGISNSFCVVGNSIMFTSICTTAYLAPKLYKSSNRGMNWTVLPITPFTGMADKNVYLAFKDTNNGIAANTAGLVATTTNGGLTWSDPVTLDAQGFLAAHYISANTYIIGGGSSTTCPVYVTVNGGGSWRKLDFPQTSFGIRNIKFFDNSTGWAGFYTGQIAKWNGGDITFTSPSALQVLYKINMKFQIRRGLFNPAIDKAFIRGTFNGWTYADTLSDPDNDSIYTRLVNINTFYRHEFKFAYLKTETNTDVWEDGANKSQVFTLPYTEYYGGYFNNDLFFENLDCGSAVMLTNGQTVQGNNTAAPSNVTKYFGADYSSGTTHSGPENLYKIFVTDSCRLIASLTKLNGINLDVFILSDCSPYKTKAMGDTKAVYTDAKPGVYYIVVDGWNNAKGSYELTVQCESGKPKGNIVWFEDFENGADNRWFVTGQEWEIGVPKSGPWASAFGSKCAATNLNGNYQDGQNTYFVTKQSIPVPSKSLNPRLKFWHWYSFSCTDYGMVRVRVNRGNGSYSNWYNLSNDYNTRNSSGAWTQTSVDLSNFSDSTVQIGFYFSSTNPSSWCGEDAGWYIDNVSIVTGSPVFVNPMTFDQEYFGDWSLEGSWECGVATVGPVFAYSSPNCVGTKLSSNYYDGMRDYLISPPFMVPAGNNSPTLRFWHFYRFGCGDFAQVKIREVGKSWSDLPGAKFEGVSSVWTSPAISLLKYSGKKVEIGFYFESTNPSSWCGEDAGWYIDDIVIEPIKNLTVLSANGGEVWSINSIKNLSWASNQLNNVNIHYTTDNGGGWLPIANNVPAAQGTYQWTVPQTPTYLAKIKISDASDGTVFDISDSTFTISPTIDWSAILNIRDNSFSQRNLTFGAAASATNGIDQLLGEYQLPPSPPTGVFDARFTLPGTPVLYSPTDFRNSTVNYAEWLIKFQPGSGGYPFVLSWNVSDLPAGDFSLVDIVNGTTVNINMKAQNNYTLSNTSVTSLKIIYKKQNCFTVNMSTDWGLYSVPLLAANMSSTALFPQAVAPVFGFDSTNGYISQSQLACGTGYWINYSSAAAVQVCGAILGLNKVPVKKGWNIIGVYSDSVSASAVTASGITINSPFYGYSNGYFNALTLLSTKAYWVKSSGVGNLVLPQNGLAKEGEPIAQINYSSDWSKVLISDADGKGSVLFLANSSCDLSSYELPPLPPSGSFDARFSTQRNVEFNDNAVKEIQFSGATYPITIKAEGLDFVLTDKATNGNIIKQSLKAGEAVQITNPGISSILISREVIPQSYELLQNFPNPFNPRTTIKFALPEKTDVSIAIFNSLGEKIMELLSGEREAGIHSVEWNAEKFTSGIYYYQMKTPKHTLVKKLILVK